MSDFKEASTRREFIRSIIRIGVTSGLISTGLYLGLRKHNGPDRLCTDDFICQSCSRIQKCELPEAVEARNAEKHSGINGSNHE